LKDRDDILIRMRCAEEKGRGAINLEQELKSMRKLLTTTMVGLSLALSLAASMSVASAQTADRDGYRSRHYAPGYEDKAYNRDGW